MGEGVMSVAVSLFWTGVIMSAITGVVSWFGGKDTKKGVVAFPFMLLLAAIVAKYLGL